MVSIDEFGRIRVAPNIFNGVAIILLLVGLPLIVAGITTYSVPSIDSDKIEEKDALISGVHPHFYSSMMSNGADMYQRYLDSDPQSPQEQYDCVNVRPYRELVPNIDASNPFYFLGTCEGQLGSADGSSYHAYSDGSDVAWYNARSDSVTAVMYQAGYQGQVQPPTAQHYQGYLGTSGDANFEWSFIALNHQLVTGSVTGSKGFELDTDDPIRSISMQMFDDSTLYDCKDNRFGEIDIKHTIEFVNGEDETYKLEDVFTTRTLNKMSANTTLYDGNQQGLCSSYLKLNYEFNGVQIMDILEFVNSDYRNTSVIVKIVKMERTDGLPFAQTFTPFSGDSNYAHSFEFTTIDSSEINLYMKGFTGVVGIGLIYLAVANTRFYNPLFGYMREALKQENVNNTSGKISIQFQENRPQPVKQRRFNFNE